MRKIDTALVAGVYTVSESAIARESTGEAGEEWDRAWVGT